MRKIIPLLILLILSVSLNAQFNNAFRKNYTIAEDYLFVDNYIDALPYFMKCDSLVPNNPNILFNIGVCHLMSKTNNELAIQYLERVTPFVSADYYGRFNETSAPVFTFYYLGLAYQEIDAFDKALESYSKFKYYLTNEDKDLMKDVTRKMEQAFTAKRYYSVPVRTRTENLGDVVNSTFADYAPVMSPDLKNIIFTSRREGSTGGKRDLTGQYFEDIYIADHNPSTGKFSNVRKLPGNVNTDGHEATISMSADGNTLFIYKDDRGIGNIYMSNKVNDEFVAPVKLASPVNSKHYENHAFLSPDSKKLYFVSNRPGGFGGKDIWVSERLGENKWGDPVNLGARINTPYDEDSPVMLADGKTLYFSSKGHENMGGYDVFVSSFENGNWTTPVNLGFPINTSKDDIFFVPTVDGSVAYFATDRYDSFGNLDLYKLVVTEPMDLMAMVKGEIKDTTLNKIILANIQVHDITNNQLIVSTSNDRVTGEYSFTVPVGRSYEVSIETQYGMVVLDKIVIPDIANEQLSFFKPYYLMAQQEYVKLDTLIKNVSIGQRMGDRFVLRNVHFDYDKSTLRSESEKELNLLVGFMKDNPDIKVEILGHTDDRGSATYNQKLSEDRAMAVTKYLQDKGISLDRLRYRGYGLTQPIASNETEMGRQLNRRVEFRIVGAGTFENMPYEILAMQEKQPEYPIEHKGDQDSDVDKKTDFYIIGGSFTFLKNAERSKQFFQTKGFSETEILGLNSVGTFRVALMKFATKDEAIRELPKFRKNLNDDSLWILEY